ncbi:MAG: aldo/keto reductase [Acidobacteriota bacterium]
MTPDVPRTVLGFDYSISRVLKGGWQLAGGHGPVDRDQALDDMDRFVEAGVTTFDCADIYTGVEALVGAYLARLRTRLGSEARDRVQVHTKYVPDLERLATLRQTDVERAIDRSLARLGVERLDLVQLHWWDYDVAGWVETAGWLDGLRTAGKIRHIGVTNFDHQRMGTLLDSGVPIVSHQVQYSLVDRRAAGAMADLCGQAGVGLLAYGAIAGGFLSSRYLGHPPPPLPLENRSLVKYRLIIDEIGGWDAFQRLLGVLDGIARRHGVGVGAVALRWVLDQPQVSGVIVGAQHARHVHEVHQACALALDAADLAAIAAVHATLAGPEGEVYGLERVKGGRHASIMKYSLNSSSTTSQAATALRAP